MHVTGAESTYPQALGHRLLLYTPSLVETPVRRIAWGRQRGEQRQGGQMVPGPQCLYF